MKLTMEEKSFLGGNQDIENIENQQEHSDKIFTAISTGSFGDYKEAEQAVLSFYIPDTSFSRCGISHALKRLKEYYGQR